MVTLTILFSAILILLLAAAILGLAWAIRQQRILILSKFELEKIRIETLSETKRQNQQTLSEMKSQNTEAHHLMLQLLTTIEGRQNSSSETLKLLDKTVGLLSSKEPLAYQAIQTMNAVGEPQVVSSEENERRMLNDNFDGASSLDDPRLAAELSGLI